jgi:hypothetical protein
VKALQWYLTNKARLKLEVELMESNGVNFQLYTDEHGNLLWRGPLLVCNHYHSDVRLVYPENFPYQKMDVYVLGPKLPLVTHHVSSEGKICYMRGEEWSPEWTAYAVYLTTIRFLNDFYNGKMYETWYLRLPSSQYQVSQPQDENKNIFKRMWRAVFG